jgi:hypothetical protein
MKIEELHLVALQCRVVGPQSDQVSHSAHQSLVAEVGLTRPIHGVFLLKSRVGMIGVVNVTEFLSGQKHGNPA